MNRIPGQSARSELPIYLLIVLAVIICFGNLVRAEFTLWDDVYNIAQNPHLNPPSIEKIAWYWYSAAYSLYVPVTYTVWSLLAVIAYLPTPDEFGTHLNPQIFHGANVLCHAIAAIAAYRLIEWIVRARWAACAGALVFALHPVQVEPVAWAAGLKDVLAGTFALIAIWQYMLAVDPMQTTHTWSRYARYGWATLALVLGLLSKPSAMVAPAIALVLDVVILRRAVWKSGAALAPWFVLAIACAVIAKLAQPAPDVPRPPLWARPLIAGDTLAFYLRQIVFPLHLAIDYGRRPSAIMQQSWFYVAWLIPSALFMLLGWNRRRFPRLWAAALIFIIGVAPMLGFSTFLFQYYSTTTDHYLYISMLGVGIAVASIVTRAASRSRVVVPIVVALLLLLLAVRSILQTRFWMNDQTLFNHAIYINPDTYVARNNLGVYCRYRRENERAFELFREAVIRRPEIWQGRENLGSALIERGEIEEGNAHIREAIRLIDGLSPSTRARLETDRERLRSLVTSAP